jgi:hypothetical protein
MKGVTTSISVINLNVNGLDSLTKDIDWKIRLKSKTQTFVSYKRHTNWKRQT